MRELIALGGARGVWDELEQARALFPQADIGAANDSGADYPGRLKLWVSLHPEKFRGWRGKRLRREYPTGGCLAIAPRRAEGVDLVVPFIGSGCSGLYLCQVAALEFGYRRIIVCGMPLTATPHYFGGEAWAVATHYRNGWKEASQQELKDRIRSMSGWTRELLGGPEDWLAVPAS